MADTKVFLLGANGPTPVKAIDNGDGTYSLAVSAAGGSGGAVTIADGANVAQGAVADAAVTNPAASGTVVGILKGLLSVLGLTSAAAVITDANGTIQQYLRGLVVLMLSLINKTTGYGTSVSITRPNDTSVYAAGDIIGTATGSTAALTFANMGPSGTEIMLTSAALEIDVAAVPSGATSYTLRLYNVTPPSALGDNAAWDLPSGDRTAYLGSIPLGTIVDLGSTLRVSTDGINKQVKLSGTSLFAYLVTDTGYTPTAQSVQVASIHSVAL